MRALTKLASIVIVFGSVAVLRAQSETSAPTTSPAPAPTQAMTVAEMQASALRLEGQMQTDNREMIHFQEIARKQKDVIKLNCVNDRLVQVKAQLNNADSQKALLNDALTKGSDDRHALYRDLNDTATSVKTLRAEADTCIGTPDLYRQESGVIVDHPEIIDDPTKVDPFTQFTDQVEAPAYASPFD